MAITVTDYGDVMTKATMEDTALAVSCLHGNLQPMHDANYTVHRTQHSQSLLNVIQVLSVTFENMDFDLLGCDAFQSCRWLPTFLR